MRLIDADALMEKCNEDIEAVKDISQRVDGILDAIMNIHECPTIDAEPIVYCKDCVKHNMKVGFDENGHTVWKEDACPLVIWRGKAKGHEYDYQFCAYGKRRNDEEIIHQYHERHKEVLKEMSMPVGRNVMGALGERRSDETD